MQLYTMANVNTVYYNNNWNFTVSRNSGLEIMHVHGVDNMDRVATLTDCAILDGIHLELSKYILLLLQNTNLL